MSTKRTPNGNLRIVTPMDTYIEAVAEHSADGRMLLLAGTVRGATQISVDLTSPEAHALAGEIAPDIFVRATAAVTRTTDHYVARLNETYTERDQARTQRDKAQSELAETRKALEQTMAARDRLLAELRGGGLRAPEPILTKEQFKELHKAMSNWGPDEKPTVDLNVEPLPNGDAKITIPAHGEREEETFTAEGVHAGTEQGGIWLARDEAPPFELTKEQERRNIALGAARDVMCASHNQTVGTAADYVTDAPSDVPALLLVAQWILDGKMTEGLDR